MTTTQDRFDTPPPFGTKELRLPDNLRRALKLHMEELREYYRNYKWGGQVGFGERPAVVVIDLAPWWTDPKHFPRGTDLDSVVDATAAILEPAREAGIPIFFTTFGSDPAEPVTPFDMKIGGAHQAFDPEDLKELEIDARLARRPNERIIYKRYASCFKGTNFHENLAALKVDTLIVTGVSTSHCVYATCRDAVDSYRVIVPREAVGERCELMHEVNLLDIEFELADVIPSTEVVKHLAGLIASG